MRSHIGVPVGEKRLLAATVCTDEYLSLFLAGAVRRLNQLEPQLARATAAQRGRRFDVGTHVIFIDARSKETPVAT